MNQWWRFTRKTQPKPKSIRGHQWRGSLEARVGRDTNAPGLSVGPPGPAGAPERAEAGSEPELWFSEVGRRVDRGGGPCPELWFSEVGRRVDRRGGPCPELWISESGRGRRHSALGNRGKQNTRPKPKSILGYQWLGSFGARAGWDSNARA